MAESDDSRKINGFSIFGLIVFVAVMIPVLRPCSIPLGRPLTRFLSHLAVKARVLDPPRPPLPSSAGENGHAGPSSETKRASEETARPQAIDVDQEKGWHVPLDLTTSPPLGVLLLLATTTIDGSVLRKGVVGDGSSRPYDVIVLFISLAYIATALDSTGGLRALAFYVSQKGGGSGLKLYLLLYLFFFVCGMIFGNDPIILSGTAFLAYFTKVTGITPPTAWVFMEFLAANVASAVLVSSNPTNVLLAQAFDLNFLTGYTKYTIIPSVVAAVVAYPLLLFLFRFFHPPASSSSSDKPSMYIPRRIETPDVSPRSALVDPAGAYFHTGLMLVTLATLVGTSFAKGAEVWMVTMPGGVIAFLRDVWHDWHTAGKSKRSSTPPPSTKEEQADGEISPPDKTDAVYPPAPSSALQRRSSRRSLPTLIRMLQRRFPTTTTTIARLPLPLLPFAISMFILVRSLVYLGWVSIFAGWMAHICTSPASTAFFVGFLGSLVLCPLVGTNIGATILLVEIIANKRFISAPHVQADPRILKAAIFATALASNIGAFSFTFAASLAGLLWVRILAQKHVFISAREFAAWNAAPVVLLTAVAMLVVWAEVMAF